MYSSLKLKGVWDDKMAFDYTAVPFIKAGFDIFSKRGLQNLVLRFELSYNNIKIQKAKVCRYYEHQCGWV